MTVLVLIATIPERRFSCERLLRELMQQSRKPDGVILCLDGYGDAPAPACGLPVIATYKTTQKSGPGQRWRVVCDFDPNTLLVNLDDDVFTAKAPHLLRELIASARENDAAACMGLTMDGKRAAPGTVSRGRLVYGAGCGLAVRVRHLYGLSALRDTIVRLGGKDALGPCGDDDALVSALLWLSQIPIWHAAGGVINAAAGTQADSQTKQRLARGETTDQQKRFIAEVTGWRYPTNQRS